MNRGLSIEVFSSVGGGAFFERMLREWESAGAEVKRCYSVREEEYRRSNGLAGRLVLRWRMYGAHPLRCWRLARRRASPAPIRVVTTNPFYAPAIVARGARDGATVNLLYDLFPEALVQAGTLRRDSAPARLCARATRFALRECDATVFLGERLRAYAEGVYGPARRAAVIPVGADGGPFRESPPGEEAGRPVILYSGVMGKMHDVDTLAAVLREAGDLGLEWRFHAMGTGYARFRAKCGKREGMNWGDPLPDESWRETMKRAQVALVTVASGAENVVMPSKTYSAMVAGQAILAVCPRKSDLADLVVRHGCGWVVEPGDVGGLGEILAGLAKDPAEVLAKRGAAFEAGHRYYDMEVIAHSWLGLFAELQEGR